MEEKTVYVVILLFSMAFCFQSGDGLLSLVIPLMVL